MLKELFDEMAIGLTAGFTLDQISYPSALLEEYNALFGTEHRGKHLDAAMAEAIVSRQDCDYCLATSSKVILRVTELSGLNLYGDVQVLKKDDLLEALLEYTRDQEEEDILDTLYEGDKQAEDIESWSTL